MTKTTIKTNRYDVTVQWTDMLREPGYQERLEDLVVDAGDTVQSAIDVAKTVRTNVTSVQVHGIAGTAIAFVSPTHSWHR